MSHGGARPGAGRKKRGMNRMSRAAREAAAKSGLLPNEFLLAVSRGTIPGMRRKATFEERMDAAKAVVGFYAPKLMAAAVKIGPGDWNPYVELVDSVKPSRGLPFKPGVKLLSDAR